MSLLADAMSGLGAALLPVAAALLFEELTFGGLVRLLLAPWPGTRKHGAAHKGTRTERAQERKPPHKPKTGLWGPRELTTPGIGRRKMIALKTLLMIVGVLLITVAAGIPLHGLWMQLRYAMKKKSGGEGMLLESGVAEPEPGPIAWRGPVALALVACVPLLMAGSMVVVPSGMGGVRISQIGGTEPGTLYPGLHFVTPHGGERADVRSARSPLHRGRCGRRQAGHEEQHDGAVARGTEHRAGGDGAVQARSEQAGERAGASAAAGG